MGRPKRSFNAETKAKIVIEALKGEKQINQLASEYEIAPNLIRNWKKEFLDNASLVFNNKREKNLQDKLKETREQKDEYAKKVGQLTMQVDWLKKI
jgi:transposase-like protein